MRRAVVDIDQAALRRLLQHRRQRRLGCGEARAHEIGDADIALEPAHQPVQAVDVLLGRQRDQQRLRARIVVGIVERLHRDLQQHLVAVVARLRHRAVDLEAVRAERECHRARQLAHGRLRRGAADAEAVDDDRDARAVRLAGQLGDAGIDLGRPLAVRSDLRDRAVARRFEHALLGRRAAALRRRDRHLLALAGAAVDDGDGVAGRGGRRRADACAGPDRRICSAPCAGAEVTTGSVALVGMLEATIIGSPPSGSLATSAQPAKVMTHRPSSPAITCGMATGILKRRRFLVPWPSGVSSSSATA